MTPERWQQISRLYHAVLARESGVRAAFLAEACGTDGELRAALEVLLKDETAKGFLSPPSLEEMAGALIDSNAMATADMLGRRLGPYRIEREIGRGGMGTVYLADRVDDIFSRRVAIKVVRPEFGNADIVSRFRQEREILASLDHPAIARVIDGGSTDDGLPYLVMDHVDGQPIDAWCDQRQLDVTRRLALFRDVCAGVQHAHDRHVLHRDLKPANIFVTADGAVKLLDFGIAKLLGAGAAIHLSADTVSSARVMTPTYASPEQVRGESLSITSDVYALGVILYELLTGHWPYGTDSRVLHEVARAVCEIEPIVPSVVVGELEDRRQLEGDLDAILLKALDKDPARRYASAGAFSDDVRRHLEGLSVAARQDTYRYRIGKFIRRHRAGVAAAIVIAIAQQVSFLTTVWEIRVKVPVPLLPGAIIDVRPELISLTYLALALLVGTAYVSRAQLWRAASSVGGGAIFSVFVTVVPIWMGWRRFVALQHAKESLLLLYTIGVLYGAIIALVGWRIARRFGWRGQTVFVVVVSIGGPIRERVYLSAAHLMVSAPGAAPWIANTLSWVCALLLSHGIMRLVAGPAGNDRLARTSAARL